MQIGRGWALSSSSLGSNFRGYVFMKFINILMAPTSDQAAHSYKLRSPSPKTQQGHGVSAAVHTGSQLLP